MPDKIRIFIADQQPLFRQGVTSVLASANDIEVCGDAPLSDGLVSLVEGAAADVILMDINYPALTGLEIARYLKQYLPNVAIIILTPQYDDNQLFQAIKARVSAYLNRQATPDELLNTIRLVASGRYPINDSFISNPKVAERILNQFQHLYWGKEAETITSPLTHRETEVLNYMAEGYLNKQIATTLGISEQTIKNHVTSILRKLDANVRTEAVITALRKGFISLESKGD